MNWLRKKLNRTEDECCGERLSAYIDRELTPEQVTALERHLAECEDCRWNLVTLQQTVEWTRSAAPVRVPRVFTIQVEAGAPQTVRARRPAWAVPLLQGATALVALLFVVVVAGDLILGGTTPQLQPQTVAVQMPTMVAQAATSQPVAATMVVELAVAAPTEVAAELPPAEQAVAKAAPAEPTAAPLAAMAAPAVATPTPTYPGEALGIGGGEPEVSVTMEVLAAAAEASASVARAAATSTVTVTLAFTTALPFPTPTPTVEVTLTELVAYAEVVTLTVTATPEVYVAATAAPTRALVDTATAAPPVETAIPAPVQIEVTVSEAERDEMPAAMAQETTNAAEPSQAPAALSEVPVGLGAGPEPTVVAAAPEGGAADQGARSGEEPGIVGTLRKSLGPWFGVAEIGLGAAFVLLALVTMVVMLRRKPR